MATQRWIGSAIALAQVNTITVGGAAAGGQLYSVTISGKSVTYQAGNADTNALIATGLYTLLIASLIPEFKEITWTNPSNGVILGTSAVAGRPFTQTSSATGTGTLTTQAGVGAPTNAAFVQNDAGGTLLNNTTYYYRVTAFNNIGESLPSAETSIATSGNGANAHTVVVNWNAAAGNVTGYKVYGRTTGAEQLLIVLGNVLTWTDTGALAPAGAMPTVNTSVNSGPNDLSNVANWSLGVLPIAADDIYFDLANIPALYNLNALAGILFNSLNIPAVYTSNIGLAQFNAAGYWEYRPLYLQVSATTTVIGAGLGTGSGLLKIDSQAQTTTLLVYGTASGTEGGAGAVGLAWKGSSASNVVQVLKGSVGVAIRPGETANVATLTVGYISNQSGDATVTCGPGTTLANINQTGGTLTISSAATTINELGGTLYVTGTAVNITTLTLDAGTCYYQSSGTITTLNIGGTGSAQFTRDLRNRTITTINAYAGAIINDPDKTINSGGAVSVNLVRCDQTQVNLNFGKGRTLAVT